MGDLQIIYIYVAKKGIEHDIIYYIGIAKNCL